MPPDPPDRPTIMSSAPLDFPDSLQLNSATPPNLPDLQLLDRSFLCNEEVYVLILKGAVPSSYPLITGLCTTWKPLSGIIVAKMSKHMAQYMSRAQKGIGKNTREAKHQLLVDKSLETFAIYAIPACRSLPGPLAISAHFDLLLYSVLPVIYSIPEH
ncbi:hypothetical protein P4O66_003100 [Electrophorus voltai]|uniref:Uncharacterized protein n=1 Tax=Electrophorus voltai TaxID=2609070 RepID=A0AAD8YR28_9TELE|nr:hypothetical protein P4O66_003100 [Electrophorus voltai]